VNADVVAAAATGDVGDWLRWALAFVVPGGAVAAYLAWRKDRRDEPADKADALRNLMGLAETASVNSAKAAVEAGEAKVSAANAVAEAAVARSHAAKAVAELEIVRADSLRQDALIDKMDRRIISLTKAVNVWAKFGREIHDRWDELRTHLTPPPLPDQPDIEQEG
jgi:hypothetical protein